MNPSTRIRSNTKRREQVQSIDRLAVGCFAGVMIVLATSAFAADEQRSPQPSEQAVAESRLEFRADWQARYRSARTYGQKASLARAIKDQAAIAQEDLLAYSLYLEAKELALSARDVSLAMQVVAGMGRRFELDMVKDQIKVIRAAAENARSATQQKDVVAESRGLAERCAQLGRTNDAIALLQLAIPMAKRARDPASAKSLEAAIRSIEDKQQALANPDSALAYLRRFPKDPHANYVAGLGCFADARWNDGVRNLTHATHIPGLAEVAKRDAVGASDAAAYVDLAKRWSEVARSSPERTVLFRRSLYWLHRAIPERTGNDRKALEQRVSEIGRLVAGAKSAQRAGSLADTHPKPNVQATHVETVRAKPPASDHQPPQAKVVERRPQQESRRPTSRRMAHSGGVFGAAFGPAPLLATCGKDGLVKIWNVDRGEMLMELRGHAGPVYDVAISPDGRMLASAGDDKTLKLWKLPPLDQLIDSDAVAPKPQSLIGHSTRLRSVALSHDGSAVVTCADDRTVAFWNIRTGRALVQRRHKGIVYDVACSPRSLIAASAGEDRLVNTWRGAAPAAFLSGHTMKIFALAFSNDGRTLVSAGEGPSVRIWNLAKGSSQTIAGDPVATLDLAFSPKRSVVALAGKSKSVLIWDLKPAKPIAVLDGHRDAVECVAFSPDDRLLVSGDRHGELLFWSTAVQPQE